MAIEGARLLVGKGVVLPLDELLATDSGAADLTTDIEAPLYEPFKIDGKTWYMPQGWNNMVIYYNTKVFNDAGVEPPRPDWTWDDFLATAKQLTTGSGADQVYGFGVPFFNFGLMPWLFSNGTNQLNDDWTESNLDDPKVLESITFVHDLVHVHKVAPSVEGTDTGQLFQAGKLAMMGAGQWPVSGFISSNFTDYDIQYWPRKVSQTTVIGVGGWGIFKDSKQIPLAWELVKELVSKETLQASADAGIAIPVRRSIAESPGFLKVPGNAEIFYETLDDIKPVPSPANFNEVESIFMRHMSEIMSQAVSPADGLAAAHTELSAAMEKLKAGG